MIKPSNKTWSYAIGCLTLLTVAAAPSLAAACPMCKEALGSNGGDLVAGFFYSILFMLSMPFLILGGLSSYLYVLVRRARAQQQLAGTQAAAAASGRVEEPAGV